MIIGLSGKKQSGKNTVAKIINFLATGGLKTYTSVEGFMKYYDDAFRPNGPGYPWQEKLFADKLKDIVCMLIGCTREQLENNTFKETSLGEEWSCWLIPNGKYPRLFPIDVDIKWIAKGDPYFKREMTPRMLLQLTGTDYGRQLISPNIWVNALMSEYRPLNPEVSKSMLTAIDYATCQFPNWIITDVRFPNESKIIKDRGGIVVRINRPIAGIVNKKDLHESETALDLYDGFDYTITNDKRIEELINKVELVLERANLLK